MPPTEDAGDYGGTCDTAIRVAGSRSGCVDRTGYRRIYCRRTGVLRAMTGALRTRTILT